MKFTIANGINAKKFRAICARETLVKNLRNFMKKIILTILALASTSSAFAISPAPTKYEILKKEYDMAKENIQFSDFLGTYYGGCYNSPTSTFQNSGTEGTPNNPIGMVLSTSTKSGEVNGVASYAMVFEHSGNSPETELTQGDINYQVDRSGARFTPVTINTNVAKGGISFPDETDTYFVKKGAHGSLYLYVEVRAASNRQDIPTGVNSYLICQLWTRSVPHGNRFPNLQ